MEALVITLPDPDSLQNLTVHPVTMDTLNLCHLEQRRKQSKHTPALINAQCCGTDPQKTRPEGVLEDRRVCLM